MTPAVASPPSGDGPLHAPRRAWAALAVLTAINLFNYLDRYLVPAVQEQIHQSEMHPSYVAVGFLTTAFLVVYTIATPVFGVLGDRMRRTRLIALGVGIWSIATVASGLAGSYGALFASRAAVGIGEAAYGTLAPALIASYFHESVRGRALSIFYTAMPVGAALGIVLGGEMAERFGWRTAFFVAGAPGLLLAFLALRLPEGERPVATGRWGGLGNFGTVLRIKAYRWVVAGYTAQTFAIGGLSVWMSTFIQKMHGLGVAAADRQLGVASVIGGIVGSLAGGWLGDRLLRRWSEAYLWVSGASTLVAFPLVWLAIVAPPPYYVFALTAAEVLIFMSTGPVNSRILGLVPVTMRATAMATATFAIHALGDGWSAPIIGRIADASDVRRGVMILPFVVAFAGLIWLYAAWQGERASARGAPQ